MSVSLPLFAPHLLSYLIVSLLLEAGCVGSLLEAIKSMLHTPSALLSCALKIVEVLGSFRFVAQHLLTHTSMPVAYMFTEWNVLIWSVRQFEVLIHLKLHSMRYHSHIPLLCVFMCVTIK